MKREAQNVLLFFVILSLIRNFELCSKLLSLGISKEKLAFLLLFSRLFVILRRFLEYYGKNKETASSS